MSSIYHPIFCCFYLYFLLGGHLLVCQKKTQKLEIKDVIYTHGIIIGGGIASNGYNLSFRYFDIPSTLVDNIYESDIVILQHPKEIDSRSQIARNSDHNYVFGKINNLFALRLGVGQSREITDKTDLRSVRITYLYSGGLSLGILKPEYIKVNESKKLNELKIETRRFDYTKHNLSNIYDGTSFFEGFSEISLLPGIYLKGGISVDFASSKKYSHILELGVAIDYYFKKVPVMSPIIENYSSFVGFYANYYYGFRWY